MLAVTPAAAAAVRALVAQCGLPEGSGLRLALEKPGNGTEPEFALCVAPAPQDEDVVVEAGDVRIFVEPAASGYFADKVLDAEGDAFTFGPASSS
jgi:Fe-S cluster assembly iron-binding protein IscA